ncbi:MAG: hypothetical protein ACI3Y4_07115 [Candidatus Cryptobacteroides sp.]
MKQVRNALILLAFLLLAPVSSFAEVVIDWNAGTTINTDYVQKDGETYRIRIKGNVTMNGYIVVGDAATAPNVTLIVEIHPDVAGPVTLKNSGSADSFFRVNQKSKLIIRGKDDTHRIILDGGTSGSTKKGTNTEMIGSAGTLEMQYVTVQNNYNSKTDNSYGAIKINPGWTDNQKLGTTTVRNCSFINCSALMGSVLFTENNKNCLDNADNKPETCAILFENVVIDGCSTTKGDGAPSSDPSQDTDPGAGWGGILRFRGAWVGNLTLRSVEIKNCYSPYGCAGVFWNAMGDKNDVNRRPILTVDGCKFHDNKSDRSGGAMRIETFCQFTGAQTEIYNNTAKIMGGGIHMYGYAGGNLGKFDVQYYLTDKLYVHDNTAQYGGGLGFQLNTGCQLEAGSSFNLHFNGARFDNNRATVKGGGVYFENTSDASKNYAVNFYLNRGSLNGNKVYHDTEDHWNSWPQGTFYDKKDSGGNVISEESYKSCGGAVFVYNSNIGHDPSEAGDLTMNKNIAMRRGGAICVTGTKASATLSSLEADGNKAQDGGALACMSTSGVAESNYSMISLGNMKLNSNTSNGWGGAVYVQRSKLEVGLSAEILNSSTYIGGGIYASDASIINIGTATISGNKAITSSSDGGLGGGIYLQDASRLTLGSATINGNYATERGGGIYLIGSSTNTMGSANLSSNEAKYGGGLCSQDKSKNEIGSATFDSNIAQINGGAIYLEKGGVLNINTGANFNNNEAVSDGGGAICVKSNHTTSDLYITGTIKNANFRYNKAYRGGAIEFDGVDAGDNANFVLENNTMENNVAKLGGALLINEAKVTYNGGLIRWNRAEYVSGGPHTSFGYFPYAYNDNCYVSHTFSGFGGGILISKDGTFKVSRIHPFGIYENYADVAGNDISTVCSDWSVYKGDSPMRESYKWYPATLDIPTPQNLDLSGFKVPVSKTSIAWMEDYNPSDAAYFAGTKQMTPGTQQRYYDMLKTIEGIRNLGLIIVNTESLSTKYLHLTIGYHYVFVRIKKKGLLKGESAVFRCAYKESESDEQYKKYLDVILTGVSDDGAEVEQLVALSVGYWQVSETDWSFTYNNSSPTTFQLSKVDAQNGVIKELEFVNTKKTTPPIVSDETMIINELSF